MDAKLDVQFIRPVDASKNGEGPISSRKKKQKSFLSKLVLFMNAEILGQQEKFRFPFDAFEFKVERVRCVGLAVSGADSETGGLGSFLG